MRRSETDRIIDEGREACSRNGFHLPPFARWSPQEALAQPDALRLMAEGGLGWAIAEFQPGRFPTHGLTVFTLRMGAPALVGRASGKLYGEKVLVARDGQVTPLHYHAVKTEDIVNRGGGRFVVELLAVDAHGRPKDEPVEAIKDVAVIRVPPRGRVVLEPGESLQLDPFVAHAFWAEGGTVVAGEVSLVNDDATDNLFILPLPAAAAIEKDALARHLLARDVPALIRKAAA
ncbi:MAG: D-lyxose/D-mannose family sugar isomerase [Alsobacter sp.]